MTPLHDSYSNLGFWKIREDPSQNVVTVIADTKAAVVNSAILSAVCIAFTTFVFFRIKDDARILFPILGIGTATLVSVLFCATTWEEKSKGALLKYDRSTDELTIRDFGLAIPSAKQNVAFSLEKYCRGRYELNLFIQGERRKFMSCLSNPFTVMVRFAAMAGIKVENYDDTGNG